MRNSDPASLENLHDIVTPGPTPWWPPAPGWYVLIVLLVIIFAWWSVRRMQRWWGNRYRREALAILQEMRVRESESPASTLMELDQLLKRVALAAWPRETVAPLSGQAWIDFLRTTGDFDGDEKVGSDSVHQNDRWHVLRDIIYSKNLRERLSPADVESVFLIARRWIQTHCSDARSTATEELATSAQVARGNSTAGADSFPGGGG